MYLESSASIGTLVFTKKGNSADGTKAEALSGVTFTLTGANGKNYTAKSAADGSVVFYNIPAGRYTLKETSLPQELLDEGYTLSDKEHDITIKANTINEPELDGDNIFLNESPKGYLTIRKVDAENEEQKLSGAVFAVYGPYDKEEAAEAAKVDLTDSPLAATLTTGNDGSITSGPLTEGYYVLLEKEAPVNYTAGEPRTVQVTRQMTETVTVENDPQAHVRITKQGKADENSPEQELAGATFEIYDAAGNQLYGVKDAKGNFENVSTDPEGREAVVITTYLDGSNRSTSPYVTLSPGDYQYKETAAPEPYTPDSQLHSFTVQEVAPAGGSGAWNLDQVLSVENILQVGQIRILKQAADYETDWTPEESEAALNGAVFGVYASKEAAEAGTLEDASGRVDTITTGTVVENGKEVYGVGYSTASLEMESPIISRSFLPRQGTM